jgi:hypothetical protein
MSVHQCQQDDALLRAWHIGVAEASKQEIGSERARGVQPMASVYNADRGDTADRERFSAADYGQVR